MSLGKMARKQEEYINVGNQKAKATCGLILDPTLLGLTTLWSKTTNSLFEVQELHLTHPFFLYLIPYFW
jgi:hypothetical protein